MTDMNEAQAMSRRRFLRASVQAGIGLVIASPLDLLAKTPKPETLSFYHTHTKERFDLCHIKGTCTPGVQKKFNSFLRDFRTGEVHPIDYRLVKILRKIQKTAGNPGIFEVISGYRSPKTNKLLRKNSTGVAQKSLHMKGKAIDVRLTGLPTKELRDIAISLKSGGVGYYAKSDFVHLDTGNFRCW
ncbi:MAG: DUF882 domain-containing protein [Desulforhopalus sp.]